MTNVVQLKQKPVDKRERATGIEMSDIWVKNRKPKDKVDEIADRSYGPDKKLRKGLILKVSPAGRKSWIYRHKVNGKVKKLKLGEYPVMPLSEARGIYDLIHDMDVPVLPTSDKPQSQTVSGMTMKRLCHRFIDEYASEHKRSWKTDEQLCKADIIPSIGHLDVGEVTSDHIEDMINDVLARGAQRQAGKVLTLTSTIFNWGLGRMRKKKQIRAKSAVRKVVKQEVIIAARSNPCEMVTVPDYIPRTYALPAEEHSEFLKSLITLPKQTADVLLLQLQTACRVGEVGGMREKELNLKKGTWNIPSERTKNGHAHKVMLSKQSIGIIENQKPQDGFVFPGPSGAVTADKIGHHINAWKDRPDPDFTSHSLRHTATTWLGEQGVPEAIQDRILNHVNNSMTARYDHHTYDAEAKVWLQKFADYLDGLCR